MGSALLVEMTNVRNFWNSLEMCIIPSEIQICPIELLDKNIYKGCPEKILA